MIEHVFLFGAAAMALLLELRATRLLAVTIALANAVAFLARLGAAHAQSSDSAPWLLSLLDVLPTCANVLVLAALAYIQVRATKSNRISGLGHSRSSLV